MSIALIDTSIFCNIVPVPRKDQQREQVMNELERNIKARTTLLLPMAVVLETGNHIAQLSDGNVRRKTAISFCQKVVEAVEGNAPWTPTPFWDVDELTTWLGLFPNEAKRGVGLGDLSLIKEWERQCALNKARRVFIWSLDKHLSGYDHSP